MDNNEKDKVKKPSFADRVKAAGKDGKNPWQSLISYFKDVRAEVKKVIWPTPKQLINNTGIVLVSIAIIGVFIWGLDFVFGTTVKAVTSFKQEKQYEQDMQNLQNLIDSIQTEEGDATTDGTETDTDTETTDSGTETEGEEATE